MASSIAEHAGVSVVSTPLPSILFALGHAYQATGVLQLTGIFEVTGLGQHIGVLAVCSLWDYNLWAVFGLHSLMNLWWELFGIDDSALGGWIANGARLLTVTIAILLTIYKDRFWGPFDATSTHVSEWDNKSSNQNRAEASVPNNGKFSFV